MKKELLMAVVVFSGLVQVDFDGKTYSLAGGDSRVFGARSDGPIFGDEINTPVGDNSYLVEMTEFFGLTPEQQRAFPAAEIAYKKAVEDFNYIEIQKQLHNDLKSGLLDMEAYSVARAELLFDYMQVQSGTGTLSEILTEKQKAEWGTFQHYYMLVPALKQKGIELTKDQIAAIRQKCNAAAKKLAGMDPTRMRLGLASVFPELLIEVRTKILTEQQRAKLPVENVPDRVKKNPGKPKVKEEQTDKR